MYNTLLSKYDCKKMKTRLPDARVRLTKVNMNYIRSRQEHAKASNRLESRYHFIQLGAVDVRLNPFAVPGSPHSRVLVRLDYARYSTARPAARSHY